MSPEGEPDITPVFITLPFDLVMAACESLLDVDAATGISLAAWPEVAALITAVETATAWPLWRVEATR